jgi:hypothetical protein
MNYETACRIIGSRKFNKSRRKGAAGIRTKSFAWRLNQFAMKVRFLRLNRKDDE